MTLLLKALRRIDSASSLPRPHFLAKIAPKDPSPPSHKASAQYNILARQIIAQMAKLDRAVVMFTSPGESGSQLALFKPLAAAMQETLDIDLEILVVDTAALSSQVAWTEQVRHTSVPGVSILSGGRQNTIAQNLNWGTLLAEMKDRYPWVLLNAPPADDPLAMQLAAHCDGVYLALRLHHTSRRASHRAVDRLNHCGAHILGTVVVGG